MDDLAAVAGRRTRWLYDELSPRPQWRTVFGQAQPLEPFPAPDRRYLTGLVWNYALHARVCIERGRFWPAEYWPS